MKIKTIALVLMCCAPSLSAAACVAQDDASNRWRQWAPAEEMQSPTSALDEACIDVAAFIARQSAPVIAPPPARPSSPSPTGSKPTPASSNGRFNMTQNGKPMTADDFDAWMRANGYRVAGSTAPSAPPPPVECKPTKDKPCPKK